MRLASLSKPPRSDRRRTRRTGVAAVEFAMVAFPFFFMMFAVMQLGLLFVIDSVLENATLESARLIRTGQASGRNLTPAQFKTELCSHMSVFSADCAARASVDVREVPQFANQVLPDPFANGIANVGNLNYTNGSPGSLMLVRVWYRQPLIAPTMYQALARLSSGETMLTVTTAFRSEPY